jgi:CHAT domain-containing protein
MDRYYGDLARFLSRSHDVIPFPYDWRESVLMTGADALAAAVKEALQRTDKPIRFLAHSMGGLVVRAFIDAHPGLWADVKRRSGSRFVMLGTPTGGAFSMIHTMMGRAKAIKQLALADLVHSKSELLEIVTSMPGPAQLLPSDEGGHYLKRDTWAGLRNLDDGDWVLPPETVFKASRDAHAVIGGQNLEPELTCYVAGHGEEPTPSDIRIDHVDGGSKKVTFLGTFAGDGTVTWKTGIPAGIDPYYMDAIHGDLARTKSAFPAISDLLVRGETTGLSRTPPTRSRDGSADLIELPDVELEIYPQPEDVIDSFLGANKTAEIQALKRIQHIGVTMVHGDLRFARHPVLVGHYLGDPINGAEGALDQCLANHLSEVRNLGLYPGAIETCEVILRLDRNPGGAVIAGLGRFGSLTPGQLRKTVNRAVLRYVLSLQQRAIDQGKDLTEMEPIALTSLVIGHKGANMTVQQSVQAILEAVADANLALSDTTPIAKLEFMEIFEDTAFKAASALHSASQNGQMAGLFQFDNRIKSGNGARLRMDFGTEPDSWQRIAVSRNVDELDVLDFTVITEGAKADFKKTAVQSEVIERLLTESRQGTATQRNLGKLLFELMIPLELKSFAQNDQKIQLILDERTAHIPWELMEDDISTFGEGLYQSSGKSDFKPLVIRTPIIRQLVTDGSTVPRANDNIALVVGDPKSSLPALPGAEQEARLVAERLDKDGDFEVDALIVPESGISVLERAMLKPYKVMHFAAHGVYDDKGPVHRAGLVLSDGISLTSAELGNLRYIPELVFLN